MSARAEALAKQFDAKAAEMTEAIRTLVAAGKSIPNFTMAMLDEANAKHARDYAGCTKAETLELHQKGAAGAAAGVRGLSDADLDQSGVVLTGASAMTAQQVVEGILISHITSHLESIRKTIGR
jgi:hypothetical protein